MEFPLYPQDSRRDTLRGNWIHRIRGGPPLQDGPYYDNFLMSPKGWMRL